MTTIERTLTASFIPVTVRSGVKVLRAAAYLRVSDIKQLQGGGMERQLKKIREYCRLKGYILEEIYIYEESITGVVYREREQLTKLRMAARRGEFDVVVIEHTDRLAREDEIQTIIFEDLSYHQVRLESATQNLENTPVGRLMMHLYGFIAGEDRRRILFRTYEGKQARAGKGLLGGSDALYGYRFIAGEVEAKGEKVKKKNLKYAIDEDEEVIVHLVYDLFVCGLENGPMTLYGIAKFLMSTGVPTRKGGAIWHPSMIQNILSKEEYTGVKYQFKERTVRQYGQPKRIVSNPPELWIKAPDGTIPKIIEVGQWMKAQEKLEANKQEAARRNKNPQDTLMRCGYAFCGICGRKLNVRRFARKVKGGETRHIAYKCDRNILDVRNEKHNVVIASHIVDKAVWDIALRIVCNPSLLEKALEDRRENQETIVEAEPIQAALKKTMKSIDNQQYVIDNAEDTDTINGAIAMLAQLNTRKRALEKQLQEVQFDERRVENEKQSLADFKEWCTTVEAKLTDETYVFSYEEKRNAIKRLGLVVYVWPYDHEDGIRFTIECLPLELVQSHDMSGDIVYTAACRRVNKARKQNGADYIHDDTIPCKQKPLLTWNFSGEGNILQS